MIGRASSTATQTASGWCASLRVHSAQLRSARSPDSDHVRRQNVSVENGHGQYVCDASSHPNCRATFVFLLLDQFSFLPFISATEVLRNANRALNEFRYSWRCCSADGCSVRSSSGLMVDVQHGLEPLNKGEILVVVGGMDIHAASTDKVLSWLRRQSVRGSMIGGLCTAGYTLAKAGLLTNRSCTLHWEYRDSIAETFPDLSLADRAYVIDGNRFTTNGGTSSIDLMLDFVARIEGAQLANEVAAIMNYSEIRHLQNLGGSSGAAPAGTLHPQVRRAIHIMEQHQEDPISPSQIAAEIGISTRQLERVFAKVLGTSPKQYYVNLRLRRAARLLVQTTLPITEVAVACGFSTMSTFSKLFRRATGVSPSELRSSRRSVCML